MSNKITDKISDAGHAVVEGAKTAGQAVVDGAKTVGHKIADGATQAADWAKEKTGIGSGCAKDVKERMDVIASCGKKVGVVTGSTGDDIASREFGKTSPDIRRFESTPVVISELVNSGVDAAIGDNGVIAFRVQEHKSLKTVADANFPKEYFGIVVKQGNKVLLDKLNAGLAAVKADGSYAQIYKQWFQAEAPALPAQ